MPNDRGPEAVPKQEHLQAAMPRMTTHLPRILLLGPAELQGHLWSQSCLP